MRSGPWLAAGVTLVVVVAAVGAFRAATSPATRLAASSDASSGAGENPLVVYCAAGIKSPIEGAVGDYQREFGIPVQLEYAGSGALVGTIKAARRGDLFVAADETYLGVLKDDGLIEETLPLAMQRPVLAVRRDDPRAVTRLEDLADHAIRVGLANPGSAAVGKVSQQILEALGLWTRVREAIEARGVFKPTVSDLANDLKLGTIDAAILWDATVRQYPELRANPIDPALAHEEMITVGVLATAQKPSRALHLARYLAARDKGLLAFERLGYRAAEGDPWAERPALTVFCGGVLRPAVEETLARFQAREGVELNTVYNGCGILVGQIKAGGLPDAYFACDRSFMSMVNQHFAAPHDVSGTRMVIAVPPGNPRGIDNLAGLGAEGLRVGVCNEQQSALGALTAEALRQAGLYDDVMKNVVVQVPTADMLVAQMRTGSLDAAVVFEANYRRVAGHLDLVELGVASQEVVQPLAIGKSTRFPQLATRLVAALEAGDSRKQFLAQGFQWMLPEAPPGANP